MNKITFTNSSVIDKITISDDVKVTYEAELATLNGTAVTTSCAFASQGQMVKNIGNNSSNAINFDTVDVPVQGDYKVDVSYYATAPKNVAVKINGGAAQTLPVPASGAWCYQ